MRTRTPALLLLASFTLASPLLSSLGLNAHAPGARAARARGLPVLTLGLMGFDEPLARGVLREKRNATKVLQLMEKGRHCVLVVLLLGNVRPPDH
ncbi:hypothetical protein B0H10DRAFT_2244928 [Mycena sp. CBHHK59/15]|nr:hypothetical protein B0H10DRAFT_2244928 [Mycena sp. CBHHK59/15]